jgi:MoaA/NifB/PqqE/SkfB family radical SAM enzyme
MKNINVSNKAVQHGLDRKNTSKMQSLWIEIPGICNLACSYCYACGGEKLNAMNLMDWNIYESILLQAKKAGIDSIGIPGAGESLLQANKVLTMQIIYKCAELGIFVTLFTTGEFLYKEIVNELYKLPVEIMLKGNSLNPLLQDKFVSDFSRGRIIEGFGAKRNSAIELLMDTRFNEENGCMKGFNRKSRMAMVTSIMTDHDGGISNLEEIVDILRFCRKNNIIFDCDSLLKRGRGANCSLCAEDQEVKTKLEELQKIDREEFRNIWELSQSYVGTICDRYMHHLYINQYGEIRPCIGAMDLDLGNIKNISLLDAWDSSEMHIIRNKRYRGKCADECVNFTDSKCNSCLGRRTTNLNNDFLNNNGYVETIGCWNFKKRKGC